MNTAGIVRARAPLRLGLAGGGTDLSPYCDTYGGYVLSATIDRYAYAVARPTEEFLVRLISSDLQIRYSGPLEIPLALDGKLNLHKAVYNQMVQRYNDHKPIPLELSTFCDAPIGSGLGSSSTIVVAMLQALTELLNVPFEAYRMAQLAFKVEREDCDLQGGRQDQYSAAFGGFNFMEFYSGERAVINPLRIKPQTLWELESSLLLFFSGVSRESGAIIAEQTENIRIGETEALDAMHALKREALEMKESLLKGDFGGMVECMRESWDNKRRTARTVSNAHMDEIYDAAIHAGALAGKISGAGGGGFMLFFVPPERRMDVIRALNPFEGQLSNCHFTKNGAHAWRST